MSEAQFDVLIVGAGMAGAALALALSESNLRLGLIEARTINKDIIEVGIGSLESYSSRVSAITPASQALLESLGVWESICKKRVSPFRAMEIWDAEGSGNIEFCSEEISAPLLGHIVENSVINSALLDAVARHGRVEFFSPVELVGLDEGDRGITINLKDGRKLSTSLLVAADGALSKVRTLAGFKTREWDYGHQALVATVQTEFDPSMTARQSFITSGPLAFLPLCSAGNKHFCSIVWSATPELSDELYNLEEDEFCRRLERAFESRLGVIKAISKRSTFPLRQRHARDYIKPGIALVADAAHTIHPLAGQGINIGLQDVRVLAMELLKAHKREQPLGSIEVLKRYQRQRKGDNLLMMAAMDCFKLLFEQNALPVRLLRNLGIDKLSGIPVIKRKIMRYAMGAD
tara:strand:- start:24 stop:1238 length:1215 start_codon:yes stop_codon:yes gene_type:complete